MFERVLLPMDGSECAGTAVPHARAMAAAADGVVHLLRVLDSRALENASHADALRASAGEYLAGIAADLEASGVATETTVESGIPETVIRKHVDDADIDLVTIGTHGRSGLERYVLGSVAESILRQSDVSVLAVPSAAADAARVPYRRILVPTDGSEGATAAVDAGVTVAGAFDAGMHALSVVEESGLGPEVASADVLEALDREAQNAVDAATDRAREAGIEDVEGVTRRGTPYDAIREYVETADVDLVVLARHGRSGLDRYLLGSVTEKVLRTVPVPILTVKIPASAED